MESFYNWFQPSNDIMTDNFDVFVYRNPHIFPRAHEKLELLGFLDYTNHNAHIIVYSMLPISCIKMLQEFLSVRNNVTTVNFAINSQI